MFDRGLGRSGSAPDAGDQAGIVPASITMRQDVALGK
jgi:hypothetical protein